MEWFSAQIISKFSVTFHQNIVQHFEMFGNTAIFGIQRGHMLLTVQMHASPIVPKLYQLKFSHFFSQSLLNILRLFDKKMITSWQGHILSCPGQLIRCYSSLTAKDINLFQSVPILNIDFILSCKYWETPFQAQMISIMTAISTEALDFILCCKHLDSSCRRQQFPGILSEHDKRIYQHCCF